MKDLTERLRTLRGDAGDCRLISRLATDQTKRQTFGKLAAQLEEMAAEIEAVIAAKIRPAKRNGVDQRRTSWRRQG